MSRDSGPVMPLEQKCLRPGDWLIEGYSVQRVRVTRGVVRWVTKGYAGHPGGSSFKTLSDAREWIREQMGA
jgi:hypothetical protein